jgi:hypothetical protein
VVISGVVGYLMLLAVTLAIRNLDAAAAAEAPFSYILTQALGDTLGNALLWMCMGAMWFCGLSSVTSNSRRQSPSTAVWVSAIAAFAVAVWSEAYTAMVALSTIALYASYALPIYVGWQARRQGRWVERGPWDLGRWSPVVYLVALAWVAVISVLFVLPPNQLAGYTFAGFLGFVLIYWFAWMRARFKGPPVAKL